MLRVDCKANLKVAFTEKHGMALELCKFPPVGVEYSFVAPEPVRNRFIRSPIKGSFRHYKANSDVLIEAVLSPIFTDNRWVYSLANFHEAMTFNFLQLPLLRSIRFAFIKRLMMKDNFKKLIFWSHAGKETLKEYCEDYDSNLFSKSAVVYPSIREVSDDLIRYNYNTETVKLLFTGDFFRKGGANVIDAFEMAQKDFPNLKLILCCDEKIDFNTQNVLLKQRYMQKIDANKGIISRGRISRDELLSEVLPETDIYLLPTYVEAFGFAILEAMAYGIPIISTNHFAIPEMLEHGLSGYLIDTKAFDCEKLFQGYLVKEIPADFMSHVTLTLYKYLCELISSGDLRGEIGTAALRVARSRFSFRERNCKMLDIYRESFN